MTTFKAGDRVVLMGDEHRARGLLKGATGTVAFVRSEGEDSIHCIVFDDFHSGHHGAFKDRYRTDCWWVDSDNLELVPSGGVSVQDLEQQARELLAAEIDPNEPWPMHGYVLRTDALAAIVAALRRR